MISAVWGDPRAGKSNHVMAQYVIRALQTGIPVYCNIEGVNPFIISQLYDKDGQPGTPIDPSLYHAIPADCWDPWTLDPDDDRPRMIVLDEVQNLYNADLFRSDPGRRLKLQKYLTTHGHRGDAVVWLCPHPEQVDANCRRLAEHWLWVRKLNFLPKIVGGGGNRYTVMQSKGYQTKGHFLQRTNYTYDPRVQLCYRSRDVGREEIKTESDNVHASSFKLLWPILLVFLLLAMAVAYKLYQAHQINGIVNGSSKTAKKIVGASGESVYQPIQADGWYVQEDSICVDWLAGGVPVGVTCPIPKVFAGKISASTSDGRNVEINLVSQVSESRDSRQKDKLESPFSGDSKSSASTPGSTLPASAIPGPTK